MVLECNHPFCLWLCSSNHSFLFMEVSHRYMYTTLMAIKDLSAFENRLTLHSDGDGSQCCLQGWMPGVGWVGLLWEMTWTWASDRCSFQPSFYAFHTMSCQACYLLSPDLFSVWTTGMVTPLCSTVRIKRSRASSTEQAVNQWQQQTLIESLCCARCFDDLTL